MFASANIFSRYIGETRAAAGDALLIPIAQPKHLEARIVTKG